jgi:hypothetical protein
MTAVFAAAATRLWLEGRLTSEPGVRTVGMEPVWASGMLPLLKQRGIVLGHV